MAATINRPLAWAWLPVVACMGGIFYFSSIPGSHLPSLFSFQDVVFHFVVYFLLAYFFSRALKVSCANLSSKKNVSFSVIFVIIYSLTDEFHQSFVPCRTVSGWDLVVNTLAGITGSYLRGRWHQGRA